MSALKHMADSVTVSDLPAGMDAYAGYAGGLFANERLVVKRFPNALHKSVAVNASENADILDIEAGDATPAQFPAWCARQKARGVKLPGAYANASTMPQVIAQATAAHITDYVRWVAHFDGVAELEGDAQAKQYADHGPNGEHYDRSVFDPSFFGPTVPAVNPVRYDWFDNVTRNIYGQRFNERVLVERYDKLRTHGVLNRIRLTPVRRQLLIAADRVYAVALQHGTDGKPNWKVDRLGWRRQQLIHRVQGQRFV